MIEAQSGEAIELVREALLTALTIGAPVLVVGMLVGIAMGLIQALTQVQDQTVAFVPKLLAMAAILLACLPWLLDRLLEFTRQAFSLGASGSL
jgi:flagellar biosynthetic protein FliQ